MLLEGHQSLVADLICQDTYRRAVARAVFPGAVVLDLGTGTGIHALFACQAGAGRVYAVERSAIIDLARQVARANGCADRITFIHADVRDAVLPERVDVIVAHHAPEDLFALLPAARRRFLKPSGRMIPESLELVAAPAEAPALHQRAVAFWREQYGVDFAPVRAAAANSVHGWRLEPSDLLSDAVSLGSCEFADPAARLAAERAVTVRRPGALHGIGAWPLERLIDDVVISAGPSSELSPDVWRGYFFPVEQPIAVDAGDEVRFAVRTGPGGWGAVWQWRLEVCDATGHVRSRSSHSSFAGQPLPVEALRRQAPDHVPALTPRGKAARLVLDRLDGRHDVAAIGEAVRREFPQLFADLHEVASFVASVLDRYAR
jgi:protein arginine N-methyltransferase 1